MRYRRRDILSTNRNWLPTVLMALALLTACSAEKEPMIIDKVRIGLALQPSSALVLVAAEKGYFSQSGLDAEVLEYPSGKRALIEGLLPGNVDIAVSTEVPIAEAALQGTKMKLVASTFTASNVNRVIARKDAGIEKPEDIAGKRVATQKHSAVHYFLHLFLLEHGLAESDIRLSFTKAEELPASLEWGTIDAFSMREPYISEAAVRLPNNHVIFAAPGAYKQFDIVVVSPELQKQRSRVIEKFLRALQMAEEYIEQHPKEAQIIVAYKFGVVPETVAAGWGDYQFQLGMGQPLLLLLEDIARWMRSDEQAIPNFLEMMAFEGLEKTKPQGITVFR
ncbi:ABC-type nitrate/sulfonate/bicarbonate transport system, substrate-binding protein [Mariprofundus ferrinatatus]|uniref:ABC-type nitrate/sulfonate/bicarbonate transport system, substrate-binding protein n=1 Tax=Mariprofundus ferrinatatus TaxID=1921087 RepID=A0A2K8L6G9_9PROT|nr:ABC transporter substrate-binding protein [Mariprofundus ferrinatatus]ATX82877.1 ABC-type nitrate/sulfonate/bicarbonate transport system, substrate-binding protein [Mariprofundus ferrinatatus]